MLLQFYALTVLFKIFKKLITEHSIARYWQIPEPTAHNNDTVFHLRCQRAFAWKDDNRDLQIDLKTALKTSKSVV